MSGRSSRLAPRRQPQPAQPHDEAPGRGLGHALVDILVQLVLVAGAAILYFLVRGLTQGSYEAAVANAERLLEVERWLGLDVETQGQAWLLDRHWAVTAMNWVYMWGHWPVIAATLFLLFRHRKADYWWLRDAMFISGAIGLVIFVMIPVAPPRLLPDGYVDTVTEWSNSYRVLQPPALVNKYAALPSLHFGWNLILGIVVFHAVRHPLLRAFGVVSPVAMGLAVVLTGNHYVLDVVLGGAVALVGLWASWVWHRHRDADVDRFADEVDTPPTGPVPPTTDGAAEPAPRRPDDLVIDLRDHHGAARP